MACMIPVKFNWPEGIFFFFRDSTHMGQTLLQPDGGSSGNLTSFFLTSSAYVMTYCEILDIQTLKHDAYYTWHIFPYIFDTMFVDVQHWERLCKACYSKKISTSFTFVIFKQ